LAESGTEIQVSVPFSFLGDRRPATGDARRAMFSTRCFNPEIWKL